MNPAHLGLLSIGLSNIIWGLVNLINDSVVGPVDFLIVGSIQISIIVAFILFNSMVESSTQSKGDAK